MSSFPVLGHEVRPTYIVISHSYALSNMPQRSDGYVSSFDANYIPNCISGLVMMTQGQYLSTCYRKVYSIFPSSQRESLYGLLRIHLQSTLGRTIIPSEPRVPKE